MRNLAVQGANGDNNLENMQAIIRQMNSLFNQLGHEMNQTFGGNYLFSGFRTDEPPMFSQDNQRSFVITQHFNLTDISREYSFQRLIVPGSMGIPEPVSHPVSVLKLAFSGLDDTPHIPGFEVISRSILDADAYLPPAETAGGVPIMHFIRETGELVMHRDTAATFPREGVSVTYQRTGFRQGDINPIVYFTGREIIDTSTAHIPVGTEMVYNVTQYFSRAAGTSTTMPGFAIPAYRFELHLDVYNPAGGLPPDLAASLPPGAVIDFAANAVYIPTSVFQTQQRVSVTYPVLLTSPILPSGVHIKEDINIQGVELVRAIGLNGIPIPLDQIERNVSHDMHNQEIQYEFSARTLITVNSLAKNVLTDKMFADFRRFFEFADSLHISDATDLEQYFTSRGYSPEVVTRNVEAQLARENAMARDALYNQFNNMLFLIDRHVDNSTREQTQLGARMVRMELVQNRLEQDEITYNQLTSDNEDTDLILATIKRFSAEALLMASIGANSGVIQMSLANFLR
jgi:flagellin-like hook-associated protein FlgL